MLISSYHFYTVAKNDSCKKEKKRFCNISFLPSCPSPPQACQTFEGLSTAQQ